MDASDCENLFFQHVPEQFARRSVRMLFDAHRRSWDHTIAEFPATEAENVRPWYTRGKVEASLREVADLHVDDGLSHRVIRAPGSGWNHTEVEAGPILLTASAVQTPCGLVDKAEFRMGLAASNQGSLFDSGEYGSRLYVMLLHSRHRSPDQSRYGHLPASAYLAFPAADMDSYVCEINLFDRYPDVVASNLPKEWDQQAVVKFMYYARKTSWPRTA